MNAYKSDFLLGSKNKGAATHLLVATVVPLVLNDDGSLHVLVQGLLSQGVHLLPSL